MQCLVDVALLIVQLPDTDVMEIWGTGWLRKTMRSKMRQSHWAKKLQAGRCSGLQGLHPCCGLAMILPIKLNVHCVDQSI